ncbi:MAG: M81 family metallopeptidase [Rhodospirillaceae bacterium]|nr:M81 family metallopeptidase [Rhodospirillaceae bacterium]
MRVAIAGLHMECASFLPGELDYAGFERAARRGGAIAEAFAGSNTAVGGFLAVLAREGIEPVGIVHADGGAAGMAADDAFERYRQEIVEGLEALGGSIDGVLLHLHGAMVTPGRTDPDAELLAAVRAAVGADRPVVVAFDYHGNLDGDGIAPATAAFGYRLSPHTDMGETGERAADCLVRTLRGEIRPVMAVAKPGLMVPSIFSATDLVPLSGIVAAARACSETADGYVDVSVFAGFSYADVPNCGFSVVAVTDGDPTLADALARAISGEISERRHALYAPAPVLGLDEAVLHAVHRARTAVGPVVLVEHADRANDSTHGLRALLRHGAKRTVVPSLWDPGAVAAALAVGPGAEVRLQVGGHSGPLTGGPVPLEGRVRAVFPQLRYRGTAGMRAGTPVDLGDVAVIESGGVTVSLTGKSETAIDEDALTQVGLRLGDFDIVLLRSKTHFRAAFEPIASEIILMDTPDYGPADLTRLAYRHVPMDRVFPFVEDP